MNLEKYSLGIGDRFGHQGVAQLTALLLAKEKGISIVPVWNKSKREHVLINSSPADTRSEADDAVAKLSWKDSYYMDADHIGIKTVDEFIEHSDFFTIDVADFIDQPSSDEDINLFMKKASDFIGILTIPNVSCSFQITEAKLKLIAAKYLCALGEASRIYNYICKGKGSSNFITEVSLDENQAAQTPEELFFILLGLSLKEVPVQTIAPKFTGRFNKGIDYVGEVIQFAREFEDDIAVIDFAIKKFFLPANLKLSVHSGSDKFSLYKSINEILKKHNAGVHLKTAGTTWLEELIGLAEAGGEGLEIAKDIYEQSYVRIEEMMKPYLTVVDIDKSKLPNPKEVFSWTGKDFVEALRHNQSCPKFNIHFRQLLHLGYKVAAEMNNRYIKSLEKYEDIIAKNVTTNIYERHIKPLFVD
jgi:tagaturonate epimerase